MREGAVVKVRVKGATRLRVTRIRRDYWWRATIRLRATRLRRDYRWRVARGGDGKKAGFSYALRDSGVMQWRAFALRGKIIGFGEVC